MSTAKTVRNPGVPPGVRQLAGRLVRNVWVQWAREQAAPKPSWLVGWDELDADQREVDMRIGETLFDAGRRAGPGDGQVDDVAVAVLRAALDDGAVPDGHHAAVRQGVNGRWLTHCPGCTEAAGRWVARCIDPRVARTWPPELLAAPGAPDSAVVHREIARVLDLLAEDAEDHRQQRTAAWLRVHRDIHRGTPIVDDPRTGGGAGDAVAFSGEHRGRSGDVVR